MGLKEFKERIQNDEEYAQKFADVSSTEDLVKLASKDGYLFSVEDFENNTELTDAELEAAAGGRSPLAKNNFVTSRFAFDKARSAKGKG